MITATTCIPLAQVLPFVLQDGCLPSSRLRVVRRAARSLVLLLRALYTPVGVTIEAAAQAKEAVARFYKDAVAAYPVDEAAASQTGTGLGLLCGKVRARDLEVRRAQLSPAEPSSCRLCVRRLWHPGDFRRGLPD